MICWHPTKRDVRLDISQEATPLAPARGRSRLIAEYPRSVGVGLAGISLVSCLSRTSRPGFSLSNVITSAMVVSMPSTFNCKTHRPCLTPPTRPWLLTGLTLGSLTASRAWFSMREVHSQCLLFFHTSRAPRVRTEHLACLWYWTLQHWQIKGTGTERILKLQVRHDRFRASTKGSTGTGRDQSQEPALGLG
jgi:hypothetical protein